MLVALIEFHIFYYVVSGCEKGLTISPTFENQSLNYTWNNLNTRRISMTPRVAYNIHKIIRQSQFMKLTRNTNLNLFSTQCNTTKQTLYSLTLICINHTCLFCHDLQAPPRSFTEPLDREKAYQTLWVIVQTL